MNLTEAFPRGSLIFMDTAPLVYFAERSSSFWPVAAAIFVRIDAGEIRIVTSPVTLAECLVAPLRNGNTSLQQLFTDLITAGPHTLFTEIDAQAARSAAGLRAQYNVTLTDAFQIALALRTKCDGFLTNDLRLKRVTEIRMITLQDLTL
jgi:predicted nucleic acid-binding protein